MKWILLILNLFPMAAMTQDKVLIVEGSSPHLYLNHTVQARENFYSIGRMYNLNPKEIAPFNNIQMTKGLNPGQVLKIPLIEANFIQKNQATAGEVLLPVYYNVKEKEGLYRIGINHNKLSVESLKKLNNLKSEEVDAGAGLVVGFLRVKKEQVWNLTGRDNQIKENKKINNEPVDTVKATNEFRNVKEEAKIIVKEEEKKENVPVITQVNNAERTDFGGGFFKELYDQQVNTNTTMEGSGTSGVFKSKSGRNDGKYYCLFNNTVPGTIIKITNSSTGKSVYVKVLDQMPDIKQNNGLLIQVSNAAADQLGAGENNFKCTINYSK